MTKRKKSPGRTAAKDGGTAPVGGEDAAIVIALRVPAELVERMEKAAHKAGTNRSQWARDTIEAALG